jgi:putative transposase
MNTNNSSSSPREGMLLSPEAYEQKVKNLKTMKDVSAFVKELVAPTIQAMLEAEMTEHLGYEKYDTNGRNSGNSAQ